jgi:eukaryotic-like serine/threonine-protein kinase
VLAYDIILRRTDAIGAAQQLHSVIVSKLFSHAEYDTIQIVNFLGLLAKLTPDERAGLLNDLPEAFYNVISQQPFERLLDRFLNQYEPFALSAVKTWSYAETVACNMRMLFELSSSIGNRTKALDIALKAAIAAHRFRAMDICRDMIVGINNDDLAASIVGVIALYPGSFVENIEPTACKNSHVAQAIRSMKQLNR